MDNVTGKLVNLNANGSIKDQNGSITWTGTNNDSMDEIPGIDTSKYEVSNIEKSKSSAEISETDGSVGSETVKPDSSNIEIKITLAKKAPKIVGGTVTYFDDYTGTPLKSVTLPEGTVGSIINYSTQDVITSYVNMGYQFVSSDFEDGKQTYNEDANKNNFIVHLTHKKTVVTPDNPGFGFIALPSNIASQALHVSFITKPNTHTYDYTKDSTATRYYMVYKGNTAVAKDLTADSAKSEFDTIQSPSIQGYYLVNPKQQNVDGSNVSLQTTDTDIDVYYAKLVNGSVIYHDDTSNKDLMTDSLTSGKPGDTIDYTTKDKIASYEDQGYKLVSNDFTDRNETYDKDAKNNKFIVHLAHDTVPVNPENPGEPGQPINPNDPDGAKYPTESDKQSLTKTVTRTINYLDSSNKPVADSHTDSVTFSGSGVIDKVTGNFVNLNPDGSIKDQNGKPTWTVTKGSSDFAKVPSPTVKRMHVESIDPAEDADGNDIKSQTVTKDDSDITINVYYAENGTEVKNKQNIPSTQTIKFEDENGNTLHDSDKQTGTFIYSGDTYDKVTGDKLSNGSWNETQYTYNTVNVPEIKGYKVISGFTTDKDGNKVAGGLTATTDNPDIEVTIVYNKLPDKDVSERKDIKETIHYVYENGTTAKPDYTKTITLTRNGKKDQVTDEVTWEDWSTDNFDVVTSPEIKGYTADQAQIDKQPADKDLEFTVTYHKLPDKDVTDSKSIKETIHYVYKDGTTAKPDVEKTVTVTRQGKQDQATDEITWDNYDNANFNAVESPEIKGYSVDKTQIDKQTTNKDLEFTVVYSKLPDKDVTDNKPITETIHYIYEDGSTAKPDYTKTITITRDGKQDQATDQITWGNWSTDKFATVKSPVIDGYTADKTQIDEISVDKNSKDINLTVVYTKVPTETQEIVKKYNTVVKYVGENGTELIPESEGQSNLPNGSKYDNSDKKKETIEINGKTYKLVKEENTSGIINGSDVVTTYSYEEATTPSKQDSDNTPDTPKQKKPTKESHHKKTTSSNTKVTKNKKTTISAKSEMVDGKHKGIPTSTSSVLSQMSFKDNDYRTDKDHSVESSMVKSESVATESSTDNADKQKELPQTGNSDDAKLAIVGVVSALTSLIGLLGAEDKKKRNL